MLYIVCDFPTQKDIQGINYPIVNYAIIVIGLRASASIDELKKNKKIRRISEFSCVENCLSATRKPEANAFTE